MKLKAISEATTPSAEQAKADQAANAERQEQIKKVLANTNKIWNSSSTAKILADPQQAFDSLFSLAKNDKLLIHDTMPLIEELTRCTKLNNSIAILPVDPSKPEGAKIEDSWRAAKSSTIRSLIKMANKLDEGVMSTIGGLFTKLIKFIIKAAAAGIAAGATMGSSGGYRGRNLSGSKGLTKAKTDQYKIALVNAQFIDSFLVEIEKTSELIYNAPEVQTALGITP